jgi:HK97 family phage portal protein
MPRLKKSIAESVAANSGTGNTSTKDLSVPARSTLYKALTAKQCYELSIHARKAVDGKANQCAKAKVRFFSRATGDEILSGDVVDLYKHPGNYCSTYSLIRDEIAWLNIQGEFTQLAISDIPGARPNALVILDPTQLMEFPQQARSMEAIQYWNYNSAYELINADNSVVVGWMKIPFDQLCIGKLFNPNNKVRGLSPMVTGSMEISSNYFANRYNSAFFQNSASADVIVRFPKGTKQEHADAWIEEWQMRHSIYGGNSFRIAAVIGEEMQIERPNTTAKDGEFQNMKAMNAEDIGGLFGVPPSIMGFLSKTRFDTIDVELESFAENTLMPEMMLWSEAQQSQVLDRFFRRGSQGTRKQKVKLNGYMKKVAEYAFDTRTESDVIILLDPDSLPIMSKLTERKFALVDKIRIAGDLSANEAMEYVGIEVPYRAERDQIWVPGQRQNITAVTGPAEQQETDTPLEQEQDEESAPGDEQEPTAEEAP